MACCGGYSASACSDRDNDTRIRKSKSHCRRYKHTVFSVGGICDISEYCYDFCQLTVVDDTQNQYKRIVVHLYEQWYVFCLKDKNCKIVRACAERFKKRN